MELYSIVTNIGVAKIANAEITNQKLELVHYAVGDGNGSYYNPTVDQTALMNEKWRGNAIVDIDPDEPNVIVISAAMPTTVGGFMVREIGVFDAEGDLIVVGKVAEFYKPVIAEGSTLDGAFKTRLVVSNAANVVLKNDPNVITATKHYVDTEVLKISDSLGNLSEDFNNHLAQMNQHIAETKYVDTRNDNYPPSHYYAKGSGKYREFKTASIVGISANDAGGMYVAVDTTVPYDHVSGGKITQIAYADSGVILKRKSADADSWTSWTLDDAATKLINEHITKTQQWVVVKHDGQLIASGGIYSPLFFTTLQNGNGADFASIVDNRVRLKKGIYLAFLSTAYSINGTGVRSLSLPDTTMSSAATSAAVVGLSVSTTLIINTDNTTLLAQTYQDSGTNIALGDTVLKIVKVGDVV